MLEFYLPFGHPINSIADEAGYPQEFQQRLSISEDESTAGAIYELRSDTAISEERDMQHRRVVAFCDGTLLDRR